VPLAAEQSINNENRAKVKRIQIKMRFADDNDSNAVHQFGVFVACSENCLDVYLLQFGNSPSDCDGKSWVGVLQFAMRNLQQILPTWWLAHMTN